MWQLADQKRPNPKLPRLPVRAIMRQLYHAGHVLQVLHITITLDWPCATLLGCCHSVAAKLRLSLLQLGLPKQLMPQAHKHMPGQVLFAPPVSQARWATTWLTALLHACSREGHTPWV